MITATSTRTGKAVHTWQAEALLGAYAVSSSDTTAEPALVLRVSQPPSLLSSLLCATMVSEHKFVVATPELRDEVVRAITALAIGNDA